MQSIPCKFLHLKTHPLLVAIRVAPCDGPPAGRMGIVPILHIILFRQPARPGIADVVLAQEVLDLRRSLLVYQIPAPHLSLMRTTGMPDGDGTRLARMQSRIRENLPWAPRQPSPFPQTPSPLFFAMSEVLRYHGRVLVRHRRRLVFR